MLSDFTPASSFLLSGSYSAHGAYAQSKLALVLFSYHLQGLLAAQGSHVTANVVDPGVVNTNLYQHVFWGTRLVKKLFGWWFFKVSLHVTTGCFCVCDRSLMDGHLGAACTAFDAAAAKGRDVLCHSSHGTTLAPLVAEVRRWPQTWACMLVLVFFHKGANRLGAEKGEEVRARDAPAYRAPTPGVHGGGTWEPQNLPSMGQKCRTVLGTPDTCSWHPERGGGQSWNRTTGRPEDG